MSWQHVRQWMNEALERLGELYDYERGTIHGTVMQVAGMYTLLLVAAVIGDIGGSLLTALLRWVFP